MANTKKKGNKGKAQPVKISPEKYIRERARKLPVEKCYINPDWEESGMASIVITRKRADGKLVVGVFLTDIYCLGVKDVIYRSDMDDIDFKNLLARVYRGNYEEISYPEVHNLIYGAVEFAEEAGIEPYRDFNVAEYILDEDTDAIPLIEYEYGKNGRHFLVVGPSGKEAHYINQLKKKYGEDFDYLAPYGEFEEDEVDADTYEFQKRLNEHYSSKYHTPEKYTYQYPAYPTEASVRNQFIADALLDIENSYSLPEDIIERILALPSDEAAEDICNLMMAEIGRTYKEINDNTIGDPENGLLIHGCLLLTQLKNPKGLNVVLELLRQNMDFLDYHFGDLAPVFIYPALYACGKDNLKAIEAYLYEPGYNWYSRSQAPKALTMTAINHPERRNEVIDIYRRLLRSLVDRLPVQDGCDSGFAGNVMGELIALSAKELIPEIKDVYATGYVDDMICGDAEEVVKDIEEGCPTRRILDDYEFPDIKKQYAYLKGFDK